MPNPLSFSFSRQTNHLLILAFGGLNIVLMLFALWPYRIQHHLPPAQPDTLLYMQYGKAFAEGHPYQFFPNDGPSTGSTSHLYPWVVGVLYTLGARGDALPTAMFLLCAGLYLASLFCFERIARILFPQCCSLAMSPLLINSTLGMNCMSMSEMALFTFSTSLLVLSILNKRYLPTCILLLLSPLIRPEGIYFTCALLLLSLVRFAPQRFKMPPPPISVVLSSLAGSAIMFSLNLALTGHLQFDSIINKGYFTDSFFTAGFTQTTRDILDMIRAFLLGTGSDLRTFVFPPLVGLFLVGVGLGTYSWRPNVRSTTLAWLGLSIGASVVMTATSGWQGIQNDRYFTWFLPYLYMFLAYGLFRLCRHRPVVLTIASLSLMVYNATGAMYASTYAMELAANTGYTSDARILNDVFSTPTTFLCTVETGLNYYLPDHKVYNQYGGNTRELNDFNGVDSNLEHVKYNPLFADAKLLTHEESNMWVDALREGEALFAMPAVMTGTTLSVYNLNRTALERAKEPVQPEIRRAVAGLPEPLRIDVGYPPDERAVDYQRFTRYPRLLFKPRAEVRTINDLPVADTGYTIIGYESMTLPVQPNRDLIIVLRTAAQQRSTMILPDGPDFRDVQIGSPLRIRFLVNGQVLDPEPMSIDPRPGTFSEILTVIPGNLLTSESLNLTIGGDHISFCYWFYQPEE